MPTNDFKAFATGAGANVIAQSDFLALAALPAGFSAGVAESAQLNKVWRQSSFVTSALAQLMSDTLGIDILDDGNSAEFEANLLAALQTVGRIKLSANTTFYVAATGNDANSGLDPAHPWATLQHAWNVLQKGYDLNRFAATIQVANGTYTAGLTALGPIVGATDQASVQFIGNTSNPLSCFINVTNGICFNIGNSAAVTIKGFSLGATGAAPLGTGISIGTSGQVVFSNMNFGPCSSYHVSPTSGGVVFGSTYTINGGALAHWYAATQGIVSVQATTVSISGTPDFSGGNFAACDQGSLNVAGITFSGSATGPRYRVSLNGVIQTNGAGATYLPGSTSGTTLTGGQYA